MDLNPNMDPTNLEFESATQISKTQIQPTSKTEFWKKRWYTPFQMVTVINPTGTDYSFLFEGRPFSVKAGDSQQYPGPVANVYVNSMSKILAQMENKIEYIVDFALLEQYYERVIVDVRNLIEETPVVPTYLQQAPVGAPETPPWATPGALTPPATETAAVVASTIPAPEPVVQKPVEVKGDDGKERAFEQDGSKFRSVMNKAGNRMYYRNGQLTSEADYAKAASML